LRRNLTVAAPVCGKQLEGNREGVPEMCPVEYEEIEDKILLASKIMVDILAESLVREKVNGLSAPRFCILDVVFNGVDKPAPSSPR